MKPALSDLALPDADLDPLLDEARRLGFLGLEVAPHRIARGGAPTAAQVAAHRRRVESAGLRVVGLHALMAGRPDLGLFAPDTGRRTRDHLVHLSAVCRDLGGRTLLLGADGRSRGELSLKAAWFAARDFLEELLPRVEAHGTVLCFAPLGPAGGDFGLTAADVRILADALDHPSFGLQMNSAALVASGETGHVPFNAARGRLDQFGVQEADLGVPEPDGPGRHADFRRHLATITYSGWLVLKQRATPDARDGLRRGWSVVKDVYLRRDGHGFIPPVRPSVRPLSAAAPRVPRIAAAG